MDPKLLAILACPFCQGKLQYQQQAAQLICHFDNLIYSIKNGIPQLSRIQATSLNSKKGLLYDN